MNNILNAKIGETVEFCDWGITAVETVVARRDGITISRNRNGHLSAWTAAGPDGRKYPQNTGWIFGADATPEHAIERVLGAEAGWNGIARGAAVAEKWAGK